jgi:radical SAM protein with 4Fe4S-binding SPASM domain
LDAEDWQKILDKISFHLQALRITGGEPTLHPQFGRLMKIIDRAGVPFVLFTNGWWRARQETLKMLKDCRNLKGILVSMHAADPGGYREYTGRDGFSQAVATIRESAAGGILVGTNTLLLKTTAARLEEIANFLLGLGAATVSFGRYYGPELNGLTLTSEAMKEALERVACLHRQDPRITLSNCVPFCFLPEVHYNGRGCTSGFTHCTIGPAGDVRPCTHSSTKLGFIQQENIETLWRCEQIQAWRNQIPEACLTCVALNQCRGGCRATAQQLFLTSDPFMEGPLTTLPPLPVVDLALEDRPRLNCHIELRDSRYALSSAGRFALLSVHSEPILKAIQDRQTLGQIQEQFGYTALQLIGSLVKSGFVHLE